MKELLHRVAAYVRRYDLWRPGGRVLVACSGGADSLALLSLVLELCDEQRLTVMAAHFEHGIRGAASAADAAFVEQFCTARGIPCRIAAEDIPAYAAWRRISLEMAARERRYRFLRQIAAEMGEGTVIATGHQADDQAETVLLRLLRGTGIEGLAAMRPKTKDIVRPLLAVSRAEIEAYCQEKGLSPRRDVTNGEPDAVRNRIRLELIPLLRQSYNPEITRTLCRLAKIAQNEGDFLQSAVRAAWKEMASPVPGGWALEKSAYDRQPVAVQAGILRRLAERLDMRMSFQFVHYESLKELLRSGVTGDRRVLPKGVQAEMSYGILLVRRDHFRFESWQPVRLSVPGCTRVPELGLTVHIDFVAAPPAEPGAETIAVDAAVLPVPWEIRPRQRGDAITVEQGTKTLKKLLIDRKVPRETRGNIPVFTAGGRVFWVGGVRQAAWGRVSEETKRIARLALIWEDRSRKTENTEKSPGGAWT